MPRSGAGDYSKPAGTTAVANTLATAAKYNELADDFGAEITASLPIAGTKAMTANLPMGGFVLSGMGSGAAATESVSLGQAQKGVYKWADGTGTDAITATLSPAITSYTDGMNVIVRGAGSNTITNPTLNLNAVGVKTIFKGAGAALVAGDIAGDNHDLYLTYNSALAAAAGGWTLANPGGTTSFSINAFTNMTDPAALDTLAIADTSDSGNVKEVTVTDVLEVINLLTEDTSPDPVADYVLTYDTSATTVKKVQMNHVRPTEVWEFAISDETTALTTGVKLTTRAAYAFTCTVARISLTTTSSSGAVTLNITEAGSSIFTTQPSISAGSTTTTTAAVFGTAGPAIADDAVLAFNITASGTGAAGLKCRLYGYRTGT